MTGAGCSGSTATSPGSDAGEDATGDSAADGGEDVTSTETGTDSGTVDSSTVDSGTRDSGTVDSGTVDSGIIVDSGSVDSGTGDGSPEAAPSYAFFPNEVVQTICNHLATCCEGSNTSSFNMQQCFAVFTSFGGLNGDGLYLAEPALQADGGAAVAYNPSAAAACLADISALPCGSVHDTSWQQVTSQCFAALTGGIPVNGTGCHGSIECAPDSYCSNGTCTPILALGAPCTTNDQCQYRGTAPKTAYCDYQYPNPDAGTQTCVAAQPTGSVCGYTFYYPNECQTFVCNASSGLCDTAQLFSDPGVSQGLCDSLTIKDAGGGG